MTSENDPKTVEPMTQVRLGLQAGPSADLLNLAPEPVSIDLIFGVGSQGLTPFEYAISGMAPGEAYAAAFNAGQFRRFFEHFAERVLVALPALRQMDTFFLEMRVESVAPAGQRDIIRAMAESTDGCASGGDCGCGCHG